MKAQRQPRHFLKQSFAMHTGPRFMFLFYLQVRRMANPMAVALMAAIALGLLLAFVGLQKPRLVQRETVTGYELKSDE